MWDSYEELQWHIKYDRKMQIERLNEHLGRGESIAAFYHIHAERDLDSTLDRVQKVLDERAAEISKKEARQARWKKFQFWK